MAILNLSISISLNKIQIQTPMYFQSKNRKEAIEKVNIILDDLKGLTEAFETSIEK